MIHPKLKFSRAHFTNDARTTIEAYWTDGKRERVEWIEAKEGDMNYEHLLKFIDIDALHEATYKHIKEQNSSFEDSVLKIAKERGLVYDLSNLNNNVCKLITDLIFGDFDKEKDKEKLFMFKLQLFEVKKIKESKDRPAKAKLRKCNNIMDAVKIAIDIVKG